MISGKTKSGFEYEIDPEALDDMEFLEILVDVTGGQRARFPAFLLHFFGEEQKARLYEHCRTETGRVPASAVELEVKNILEDIRDSGTKSSVKNS